MEKIEEFKPNGFVMMKETKRNFKKWSSGEGVGES